VAGVDDPEHGDVLATAVAAAQERHGRLTVLTAWWRPTGSTEGPLTQVDDSAWPERLRTDLDRALAHLAPDPGLPLELHIRNARPGDALIEASHGAQLLVLGRHDPLLPTGSHLGPVARTVLRGAACPILLAAPRHAHQVRHHDEPAMRPV